MAKGYDFSGWATRNDLKCSDGRTIRRNAFADCDGMSVPLVWGHQHESPSDVLGHALLENRPEGVYAYGYFNDTTAGQDAREAVRHGDIKYLSIYANKLKQSPSKDVLHGMIREVSLVYAGANPGAFIDNAVIAHSDGTFDMSDDEAVMFSGEEIKMHLQHSDDGDEDYSEEGEETMGDDERTVADVFEELTDEQQAVVSYLVGEAVEQALDEAGVGEEEEYDDEEEEYDEEEYDDEDYDDEDVEHYDYDGGDAMKYNVFDSETAAPTDSLSHAEADTILADAKRFGSMKESVLAHADEYGIQDIEWLFPEYRNVDGNGAPAFINNEPQEWVKVVMNGVHHTPFSRIKSMYADIREDEARARGYMKGKLKKEEVFTLLKRTTDPQTIYKKQKLDRDDVTDITDFDVVSWIKGEMRMKLDEEIARAILYGDGRLNDSDDKINETHVRPIIDDADLYTIKKTVTPGADETVPHAIVTTAIRARSEYQGSGNPIMFTSEAVLADLLLQEDKMGRRLYKNVEELATTMRVSRIVTTAYHPSNIYGVIVNLNDYNVGADKGGAINMFDDFDIDYNQMKYLIETRISGALIKPYSAIVLKAAD